MEGLTPGRIVHYVLTSEHRHAGEHRPAMVVKVWGSPPSEPYPIQLCVFLDGSNDSLIGESNAPLTAWKTSVVFDPSGQKHGSWHWIERA